MGTTSASAGQAAKGGTSTRDSRTGLTSNAIASIAAKAKQDPAIGAIMGMGGPLDKGQSNALDNALAGATGLTLQFSPEFLQQLAPIPNLDVNMGTGYNAAFNDVFDMGVFDDLVNNALAVAQNEKYSSVGYEGSSLSSLLGLENLLGISGADKMSPGWAKTANVADSIFNALSVPLNAIENLVNPYSGAMGLLGNLIGGIGGYSDIEGLKALGSWMTEPAGSFVGSLDEALAALFTGDTGPLAERFGVYTDPQANLTQNIVKDSLQWDINQLLSGNTIWDESGQSISNNMRQAGLTGTLFDTALGVLGGTGVLNDLYASIYGNPAMANFATKSGTVSQLSGLLGQLLGATNIEGLDKASGVADLISQISAIPGDIPGSLASLLKSALVSGVSGTPTGVFSGINNLTGGTLGTTSGGTTLGTTSGGTTGGSSNGGTAGLYGTTSANGTYTSNNSILGGGNVEVSNYEQMLLDYMAQVLGQPLPDYDALEQALIDSSMGRLRPQFEDQQDLLREEMARRGVLDSGVFNETFADLLGEQGRIEADITSQAVANRTQLEQQGNLANMGYGLQAGSTALTDVLNWYIAQNSADYNASTLGLAKNAQKSEEDAALWGGIGSLISSVAPTAIDLISKLFKKDTTSTGSSNILSSLFPSSNYSGSSSSGYFYQPGSLTSKYDIF